MIPGATYPQNILDQHAERERLVWIQQNTLLNSNRNNLCLVELELGSDPNNRTLLTEQAKLLVEISQGEFDLQMEVPIYMSEV